MHETKNCCWLVLLWWLSTPALRIVFGLNAPQIHQRRPPCQPGKVPSVLAVRHGNIAIPFETKSISYLLFCLHCHFFIGYDYSPKGMKKVHANVFFSALQKGHYCPDDSETAVPCPRGKFAPSFWAKDINGCISCPPHHYAPTEGLSACLPCGSRAQQPLPGQDTCVCLAEGQVFQVSIYTCFYFILFYLIKQISSIVLQSAIFS